MRPYTRYVNLSKTIVIVVVLAPLISSARTSNSDEVIKLIERVEHYYSLESEGAWDAVYELKTPAFKKNTEKRRYMSKMAAHDKGWKLLRYEIIALRLMGSKVVMKLKFIQIPPADYLRRLGIGATRESIESLDEVVWKKVGGKWFCESAGQRLHLPLNSL